MNDYIMLVDENGQPYIAHAGFGQAIGNAVKGVGRDVRQNHKYIMKIGEGVKARYFYTPEEVAAYKQELQAKARGVVNNAKNKVESAKPKLRYYETTTNADGVKGTTVYSGKEAIKPTAKLLGTAAKAVAARKAGQTIAKAKQLPSEIADIPEKITGKDSKRMRDLMKENVEYNKNSIKRATDEETKKMHEDALELHNEYAKYYSDKYDKTLFGRAEKAANKVKGASEEVADNAKKTASSFADNMKSKSERMKDEFSKKKDAAVDKAKDVGEKAKDAVGNAKEKAAEVSEGVKAYKEWDKNPSEETFNAVKNNKTASAIRKAKSDILDKMDATVMKAAKNMKGADLLDEYHKEVEKNGLSDKANQIWDEWEKTPHGKFLNDNFIVRAQVNGLGDTVKDTVDEAKEKVSSAADKVKGKVKDKVSDVADNVKEKSGFNARENLKNAERDSDFAAKAYKDTDRADRELGNDYSYQKFEALKNLNLKNNAEDQAKYEYNRTPLGKAENVLKGESKYARHTSKEKLVEKANADLDRHELELDAKRGPIDTKHVSKEYIYALGGNTGHADEVSTVMKAENAYYAARNKYSSLTKNPNATATDLRIASKAMTDAKQSYEKQLDDLADTLQKDVVDGAKEKLAKMKK